MTRKQINPFGYLKERKQLNKPYHESAWEVKGTTAFIKRDVSEMTSFSGKTTQSLKACVTFTPNFKVVLS